MYKKMIHSLMLLAIACTASPAIALHWNNMHFIPYIGADAQWRYMDFKKGFGKNLVKPNYPQGNAYIGIKLNEYFGFEGGYERSVTKTRDTILLGTADFLGQVPLDPDFPTRYNRFSTTTKIYGPHLNVIGFLPMHDKYGLELFVSAGIVRSKIHSTTTFLTLANENLASPIVRDFVKRKFIIRLNAGLQQMLNTQFGIRIMAGWENTAQFGNIKPINADSVLIARAKNSLNVGIGLFYHFK